MHHIILSFEFPKISPEAKFFLVRFVQLYGLDKPVQLGVKELSKATGATDRVVSHSLDELVATELLNRREIVNGARGRNKREHQCTSQLIKLLEEKSNSTPLAHEQRIDHVLQGASQQDGSELSINNRLLLSVLLGHADQFGVVRHLGISGLSKLTGLNHDRVKAQLHKFLDSGIFRSSVPGATNSNLFRPTKSVHFLNLHHALLSQDQPTMRLLVIVPEDSSRMTAAAWIVQAAQDYDKKGGFDLHKQTLEFLPSDLHYKGLAALFSSLTKTPRLISLLQTKLDGYASLLLSNNWEKIVRNEPFEDRPILERIEREFKLPVRSATNDEIALQKAEWDRTLPKFIYEVSFRLAIKTKEILLHIDGLETKEIAISILPSGNANGHHTGTTVLLINGSEQVTQGKCEIFFWNNRHKKLTPRASLSEINIPTNDQYHYGLLTAPKRLNSRKSS
ncbi:Uncharacterised protein [Pseudomonas fluorescens]|uniref:Uncharacterized protein n=1 Tax=Pseudomonas fluorescens TaxID=294 RepID=A0A379IG40_PSEFL|nr:hypothetical protein [Pseudomonas fluorescens]SUD31778.1 Uncharacterised protein [Pseudomonas fluorescens]